MFGCRPVHRIPLLWRALGFALAGLLFGLVVLAYAPAAHEHLHADAGEEDHSCAIVLLTQGITAAATIGFVLRPLGGLATLVAAPVAGPSPLAPRLRPPTCGPPRS
jgi:hypothetical protein